MGSSYRGFGSICSSVWSCSSTPCLSPVILPTWLLTPLPLIPVCHVPRPCPLPALDLLLL